MIEHGSSIQALAFSLKGTLSERIKNEEFITEFLAAQQFRAGNSVCSLRGLLTEELKTFRLPDLKEHLEWLKTVKKMLDTLHVKDDLDCSNLTKTDEHNILMLRAAILDKQAVSLAKTDAVFGIYTIANLEILLCFLRCSDEKNLYHVYSFNDTPYSLEEEGENGEVYPSSFYAIPTMDSILKCCSIDYEAMLRHIKGIPFSETYSFHLNQLLLQLLSAYDESRPPRKDILDAALNLSEWLKDSDPCSEKEILILNYYQALKRKRPLEEPEIHDILSIIENKAAREELYAGAYILIGHYTAAKIHFNLMSSEAREIFRTNPIFHLWKQYNKGDIAVEKPESETPD